MEPLPLLGSPRSWGWRRRRQPGFSAFSLSVRDAESAFKFRNHRGFGKLQQNGIVGVCFQRCAVALLLLPGTCFQGVRLALWSQLWRLLTDGNPQRFLLKQLGLQLQSVLGRAQDVVLGNTSFSRLPCTFQDYVTSVRIQIVSFVLLVHSFLCKSVIR